MSLFPEALGRDEREIALLFTAELPKKVLVHNAYTTGWEHGASDYRPGTRFYDTMRELEVLHTYEQGKKAGRRARRRAWRAAKRLEETEAHWADR